MKKLFLILLLYLIIPVNAQIITGEVEYNTEKIIELKDRKIAAFSDGSYGVQYYNNPMFSWYYSSDGKLISYIQKDREEYPNRFTKFKPDGTIINKGYRVSQTESFIYNSNNKLIAHWIGENCYDKNNNIIMTRKIVK